jgi:hypothetical protein
VISPEQLATQDFDSLVILPWNLINELRQQLPSADFVTAIPILRHWQEQK